MNRKGTDTIHTKGDPMGDTPNSKGGSKMSKLHTFLKNAVHKFNEVIQRGWNWIKAKFSAKENKLYNFILKVLNGIIGFVLHDVKYIYNTVTKLNPSVRIGIIVAVGIIVYLYYAPVVVLLKLQRMAGFLMSLLIFVIFCGYLFFIVRTTSDAFDVGDIIHDNVKKENIGMNMSEVINHSLGTPPTIINVLES